MEITAAQLKSIAPLIKDKAIETFLPYLNKYCPKYQIDTPQRIVAFLSQVLHESNCFMWLTELSSGKQYEGRADLGNTSSGDGPKYKGRAPMQITGKDMYRKLSRALYGDDRLLITPEVVATPELGVIASCWLWTEVKKLNKIADEPEDWTFTDDHGKTFTKLERITYHINGGENGELERFAYYTAGKVAFDIA